MYCASPFFLAWNFLILTNQLLYFPSVSGRSFNFSRMKLIVILSLLVSAFADVFAAEHPVQQIDNGQNIAVCSTNLAASNTSLGQQSLEFFSGIFDTDKWPQRWQCGEWTSFHGWLYIISDLIIWLS